MPTLPTDVAKSTAEADYIPTEEYVNFRNPVPTGTYYLRLLAVQTTRNGQPLVGPSGPYWQLIWEHVADKYEKKRQFDNLSLSDKAAWKRREFYEAIDLDPSESTDQRIGSIVKAQIGVVIQQQGVNKGRPQNQIDRYDPITSEEFEKIEADLPPMDYVNPEAGWSDEAPEEDVDF